MIIFTLHLILIVDNYTLLSTGTQLVCRPLLLKNVILYSKIHPKQVNRSLKCQGFLKWKYRRKRSERTQRIHDTTHLTTSLKNYKQHAMHKRLSSTGRKNRTNVTRLLTHFIKASICSEVLQNVGDFGKLLSMLENGEILS